MAKHKMPSKGSQPTGRYASCPGSYVLHPGLVFCQIMVGAKCFHFRCACGGSVFLGKGWKPDNGISAQEAQGQGGVL